MIRLLRDTHLWDGTKLEKDTVFAVGSTLGRRAGCYSCGQTPHYIRYWDGQQIQEIVEYVEYSDYPMSPPQCEFTVDATPEVLAAAEEFEQKCLTKIRLTSAIQRCKRHVSNGVRVKVVRGRQNPHGTEGVVFWLGKNVYPRVGFSEDPSNRDLAKWDYLKNVEAIIPNDILEQAEAVGINVDKIA